MVEFKDYKSPGQDSQKTRFMETLTNASKELEAREAPAALEVRILSALQHHQSLPYGSSHTSWQSNVGALVGTAAVVTFLVFGKNLRQNITEDVTSKPQDQMAAMSDEPSKQTKLLTKDDKTLLPGAGSSEQLAKGKPRSGLQNEHSDSIVEPKLNDQVVSSENQPKVIEPVEHLDSHRGQTSQRIGPGTLANDAQAPSLRSAATVRNRPSSEETPIPGRPASGSPREPWIVSSSGEMPINPSKGEFVEICTQAPSVRTLSVGVSNYMGDHVKALFSGTLESGTHCWKWFGKNEAGDLVSSGTYLIHLKDGKNRVEVLQVVLAW